MVGYTHEEMIGKPQHALIHHSKPDGTPYPREECNIYAAFHDGKVHTTDSEVFWHKDGTPVPIEYTSTPTYDDKGEITGAVVVYRDITVRKIAERKAKELTEKLTRSNAELEQFAYVSSHDL